MYIYIYNVLIDNQVGQLYEDGQKKARSSDSSRYEKAIRQQLEVFMKLPAVRRSQAITIGHTGFNNPCPIAITVTWQKTTTWIKELL